MYSVYALRNYVYISIISRGSLGGKGKCSVENKLHIRAALHHNAHYWQQ